MGSIPTRGTMQREHLDLLAKSIAGHHRGLSRDIEKFIEIQAPLWEQVPALALHADNRSANPPECYKMHYYHRLHPLWLIDPASMEKRYFAAINLTNGQLVFYPHEEESLDITIDESNDAIRVEKKALKLTPLLETLIPRCIDGGFEQISAVSLLEELIPAARRPFKCSKERRENLLQWQEKMSVALNLEPPNFRKIYAMLEHF